MPDQEGLIDLLSLYTLVAMTHNVSALEKVIQHLKSKNISLTGKEITDILRPVVASDYNLYKIHSNALNELGQLKKNTPSSQKGKKG